MQTSTLVHAVIFVEYVLQFESEDNPDICSLVKYITLPLWTIFRAFFGVTFILGPILGLTVVLQINF